MPDKSTLREDVELFLEMAAGLTVELQQRQLGETYPTYVKINQLLQGRKMGVALVVVIALVHDLAESARACEN